MEPTKGRRMEPTKAKMNKKKDLLMIFLLFLSTLIVFFKVIFLRKVFFGDDFILYFYPVRMHIASILKEGILPLWTPDIFCGHPLFASNSCALLYPFNLLFTLSPSIFTFHLLIILHFFLGGLFMYLFVRTLKLDEFSSFISALSFMFSGFFFYYIRSPNLVNVAIWLPLTLYLLELYLQREKFIFVVLASLTLGLQFLGGEPQMALLNLLFLFFYCLFKFTLFLKEERKRAFKLFPIFVFLLISGIGLGAVQLFPTYELAKLSRFLTSSEEFFTSLSFSPRMLLSYLSHFGYPPSYSLRVEDVGYLDVFPTLLAFLCLYFRRERLTLFLGIVCLFSLSLALGEYNPVYRLFYNVPLVNLFRYPVKFLALYIFSLSILAGMGMNFIINTEKRINASLVILGFLILLLTTFFAYYCHREGAVLFYFEEFYLYLLKKSGVFLSLVFLSLVGLLLRQKIKLEKFKGIILLIIFLALFLNPVNLLPFLPQAKFVELLARKDIDKKLFLTSSSVYSTPQFVQFLKEEKSLYRIYNMKRAPLIRNVGLLYNIPNIIGFTPLELPRFGEAISQRNVNLINLMNAKYILYPGDVGIGDEDLRLVFEKEIKIYENKGCLPRAFLVDRYSVFNKRGALRRLRLLEADFNPREEVILEEKPEHQSREPRAKSQEPKDRGRKTEDKKSRSQEVKKSRSQEVKGSRSQGVKKSKQIQNSKFEVQIIRYSPNEVIIQANLNKPGFLVLTDTYYPGWKVYIDGKEGKIYRADYLFRAAYLQEGEHTVKYIYEPLSFKIGLLVSLGTALVLLVLTVKDGQAVVKR